MFAIVVVVLVRRSVARSSTGVLRVVMQALDRHVVAVIEQELF